MPEKGDDYALRLLRPEEVDGTFGSQIRLNMHFNIVTLHGMANIAKKVHPDFACAAGRADNGALAPFWSNLQRFIPLLYLIIRYEVWVNIESLTEQR
jgi:hypothetical protein